MIIIYSCIPFYTRLPCSHLFYVTGFHAQVCSRLITWVLQLERVLSRSSHKIKVHIYFLLFYWSAGVPEPIELCILCCRVKSQPMQWRRCHWSCVSCVVECRVSRCSGAGAIGAVYLVLSSEELADAVVPVPLELCILCCRVQSQPMQWCRCHWSCVSCVVECRVS